MDCGGAAAGALPASWLVECAVVISGMPATRRQSAGELFDGSIKLVATRYRVKVSGWWVDAVYGSEQRKYKKL